MAADPISSRPLSRPACLESEAGEPAASAPPPLRGRSSHAPGAHVTHDQALADACRPANDRILYVGMNLDSASIESAALAARLGPGGVARVLASPSPIVRFQGDHDLRQPAGIASFVDRLAHAHHLDDGQRDAIAGVLGRAPAAGRDELARVAIAWAPAEGGAKIPSRLVLSGHSAGGQIWGDHAHLAYTAFRELGQALPAAARQIEDVHLSGCFTEREVQAATEWRSTFPNLQSIWGYRGFSPLAPVGHLVAWEQATRGRSARLAEDFVAARGSATAWSASAGTVADGLSLEQRRRAVAGADRRFSDWFSGERRITEAHQPDAEADYAAYQLVAGHGAASPEERRDATARAGQMLRLRFYEVSVRGAFASAHGPVLDEAFRAVGLAPARFGELSRADALGAIASFEARAGEAGGDPVVAEARELLEGLRSLSAVVIPESFCR